MSSTFLYAAIVAVWAVVLVPMWLRRDSEAVGFSRLRARRTGAALDEQLGDLPVEPGLVHGVEHGVDHDAGSIAGFDAGSEVDAVSGLDATTDAELEGELPYARLLEDEADADEARLRDRRRRNGGRATVIARRRRRTFGLTLLVLATSVVAATGLAPWWVSLPPIGLLTGHLSLLRVAVKIDVARQREIRMERARIRAERARAAIEAEERQEAARAQIIDLAERARARDVFDQYAGAEGFEDDDDVMGDERRAVGD